MNPSDRLVLVRLASALPVNSAERRALLAALDPCQVVIETLAHAFHVPFEEDDPFWELHGSMKDQAPREKFERELAESCKRAGLSVQSHRVDRTGPPAKDPVVDNYVLKGESGSYNLHVGGTEELVYLFAVKMWKK